MTIEERLEKLELKLARAQFINRLLVVLGIGVFLVLWFFSSKIPTAQEKVMDEVRTKRFIVVDDNGIQRVFLGVIEDVPGLAMFDENGNYHVDLIVTEDGPRMALSDENGKVIWQAP